MELQITCRGCTGFFLQVITLPRPRAMPTPGPVTAAHPANYWCRMGKLAFSRYLSYVSQQFNVRPIKYHNQIIQAIRDPKAGSTVQTDLRITIFIADCSV